MRDHGTVTKTVLRQGRETERTLVVEVPQRVDRLVMIALLFDRKRLKRVCERHTQAHIQGERRDSELALRSRPDHRAVTSCRTNIAAAVFASFVLS